jgi:hypothetical protein
MGWLWPASSTPPHTSSFPYLPTSAVWRSMLPSSRDDRNRSKWSFELVNGILSPTISAVFGWILPKIMRWLSEDQCDIWVCSRLLACLLFMQLMQLMITLSASAGYLTGSDTNILAATGLAVGRDSYYRVACIPPLFAVLICKVWWDRIFHPRFTYYIPRDKEMAEAIVHSQRADNHGNHLEKRSRYPALHADLPTSMLHAKMMSLLVPVYHGRLGHGTTMMGEEQDGRPGWY